MFAYHQGNINVKLLGVPTFHKNVIAYISVEFEHVILPAEVRYTDHGVLSP